MDFNIANYEIVHEINQNYAGWYSIFTDGSKINSKVGCSFFDAKSVVGRMFKIKNNITIMAAELVAIFMALVYVSSVNCNKVVVFSDSKSALLHLVKCIKGNRGIPVAYKLLNEVIKLILKGVAVKLQWVPSHLGIKGNEEADKLARKVLVDGINLNI